MKTLKIISLGFALWGLTLIWPDINRWLTESRLALIAGISLVIILFDILAQHINGFHNHHNTGSRQPSHPTPIGL